MSARSRTLQLCRNSLKCRQRLWSFVQSPHPRQSLVQGTTVLTTGHRALAFLPTESVRLTTKRNLARLGAERALTNRPIHRNMERESAGWRAAPAMERSNARETPPDQISPHLYHVRPFLDLTTPSTSWATCTRAERFYSLKKLSTNEGLDLAIGMQGLPQRSSLLSLSSFLQNTLLP